MCHDHGVVESNIKAIIMPDGVLGLIVTRGMITHYKKLHYHLFIIAAVNACLNIAHDIITSLQTVLS